MSQNWDWQTISHMAPHKFYGLNGNGLLFKRNGLVIEPQIHGGTSATIYRSGTLALTLAASMETALRLAVENRPMWQN